jgi:uncharacterized protein (UPF0264 family)
MTELLVSVRTTAEAEAALAGGAAVLDVKEPRHGSLGRADEATIRAIVAAVAGRCPVSAALGELRQTPAVCPVPGLHYVKWGLAGFGGSSWRAALRAAAKRQRHAAPHCQVVVAAYADSSRAAAPPLQEIAAFARAERWPVLLLDTWGKDGSTLLDWLPREAIVALSRDCRRGGVHLALAGSLREEQLVQLAVANPAWFAVRTAACRGGRREMPVSRQRVGRLVRCLRQTHGEAQKITADRFSSCNVRPLAF